MHATEPRTVTRLRPDVSCRLARVIRAADGHAITVSVAGVEQPVIAHLDTVTALDRDDAVLVEHTDEGVVILGRLRRPAEPPAVPVRRDAEGRLLLDNPQGILVRCGSGTLELRRDGAIVLDGKTIHSVATGLNRIQGASIELN